MRSSSIRCCAAVLATAVLAGSQPASAVEAPTIGVYFDAAGTVCKGTVEPGVPAMVYVVLRFDGAEIAAAGTEFRFVGMPPSWIVYAEADPGILAIGDPFAGGVSAGFTQCKGAMGEPFAVYSILILAQEPEDDLEFEARTKVPSSNRNFQCPVVVACDSPFFTAHCVESVRCRINSFRPPTCAALTAVTASSWTAVKGLYAGTR